MDNIVYLLPLVGCAAMMGAMMWAMRGGHGPQAGSRVPDARVHEEVAALRAEVATLRDRQRTDAGESGRVDGS